MRTRRTHPRPASLLAILIATLPLTSCGLFAKVLGVPTDCDRYRQDLDFATSDEILRGAWDGTVTGLTADQDAPMLELDVAASRIDATEYEIEGTFQLEGRPPASIRGTVSGGCAERYLATGAAEVGPAGDPGLSPESVPPSAWLDAEVRDDGGALLWRVNASGPTYAQPLLHDGTLMLGLASASDDDLYGEATLARTESP